jgi:hypothetical protein
MTSPAIISAAPLPTATDPDPKSRVFTVMRPSMNSSPAVGSS